MENSTFLNSIWAITPEEFQRFASYDFSKLPDPLKVSSGDRVDDGEESYKSRMDRFMRQFEEKIELDDDGIATLHIEGPIMPNPDIFDRYYFNAVDSVRVAKLIRTAAQDDNVQKLVLHINSPGGMVVGTPEVGEAILEFNATGKESVAFADTLMASAAYWIGSQATTLVTTGSALVGSIGVIRPHVDASGAYEKFGYKVEIFRGGKHKVAGAMGTAMTEEQRKHIQAGVDECHAQFKATVNHHRSIAAEHMEGQVFYGTDAKEKGLVDQIVSGIDGAYSATGGSGGSAKASITANLVQGTDAEGRTTFTLHLDNSVDNPENAMSKPTDTPSAAQVELDSALARVGELEAQATAAQEQIATLTAERDSAMEAHTADLANANDRITALEADLATANACIDSLKADFDSRVAAAADEKAKELAEDLAEQKAAAIAARAGTDAATISGEGGDSADSSEYASMSTDEKWAHCATIKDADEKRAFYVKHLQNS